MALFFHQLPVGALFHANTQKSGLPFYLEGQEMLTSGTLTTSTEQQNFKSQNRDPPEGSLKLRRGWRWERYGMDGRWAGGKLRIPGSTAGAAGRRIHRTHLLSSFPNPSLAWLIIKSHCANFKIHPELIAACSLCHCFVCLCLNLPACLPLLTWLCNL